VIALKVRAEFASAIVVPRGHDVHLDALLAWVWVLRHMPDRMGGLSARSTLDDMVRAHLPVATIDVGDHQVALCSAWTFPDSTSLGTHHWTRRKDGEDLAQRSRRLSASSPERGQLNRADKIVAPYAEWVCWGQRSEVRKALELVHSVGGLRGHGAGVVTRWTVEAAEHSPVDTVVLDGEAQRNLPVEVVKSCDPTEVRLLAVEAPYWVPVRQTAAVGPGTALTLRPEVGEAIHAAA